MLALIIGVIRECFWSWVVDFEFLLNVHLGTLAQEELGGGGAS